MKAKWIGDSKILPDGVEVTILATDPDDPDARFGRQACWIKCLADGFEAPMYRSCNMDDLEIIEEVSDGRASISGSIDYEVCRKMLLGKERSNLTISQATYQEDRVVPTRSYDGRDIKQLQPDGSWKVIGPDNPLRPSVEIIEDVRRYARQIAGDTDAIRKSLNERYPIVTAHLAKND